MDKIVTLTIFHERKLRRDQINLYVRGNITKINIPMGAIKIKCPNFFNKNFVNF